MKHATHDSEVLDGPVPEHLWKPFHTVDLSALLDNTSVTTESGKGNGRLNVWRNTIPAQHFPEAGSTTVVDGIPFSLDGADSPYDNVRCAGQYLTVPQGRYDWIRLLATSERRTETEIAVHFADGQVDFEPLRVSDLWHAPAWFGESLACRTPAMHYPHHVQQRVSAGVFGVRVPVTRQTPVCGLRLPRHVAVHVFALTLQSTPPALTRRTVS